MIGLTCSWAWSIGPVLALSCLCVLTSQIVKRRRGAEPVSISFFLSIISCLPLCVYFLSLSFCLLSLMTNLSAAPVVVERGCSACEWMRHTVFFLLWKHFCLSCPVFKKKLSSSSMTMSNPNWGISLWLMQGREVFALPRCIQWLLSETLCAQILGVTQCSLHQSANEPVAILAPPQKRPRTNFLPGDSVFQSSGLPRRLPFFPPHPPPPASPANLYNVEDTQKRFPLRYMAHEVPFKQRRKCVFKILSWDKSSNKLCFGNVDKKKRKKGRSVNWNNLQ